MHVLVYGETHAVRDLLRQAAATLCPCTITVHSLVIDALRQLDDMPPPDLVLVAEDIGDDGFYVLGLVAALGERAAVDRIRVDDLEEEHARALVALGLIPAVANCGERAADETADDLVDERKPVALVRAEGQERDSLVGIGGRVAVFIDGGKRREWFAFALELLDAAHGYD